MNVWIMLGIGGGAFTLGWFLGRQKMENEEAGQAREDVWLKHFHSPPPPAQPTMHLPDFAYPVPASPAAASYYAAHPGKPPL